VLRTCYLFRGHYCASDRLTFINDVSPELREGNKKDRIQEHESERKHVNTIALIEN